MSRTIYFNGTILTMDKNHPTAKAVIVQDGYIRSTPLAASVSTIKGYDAPGSSAVCHSPQAADRRPADSQKAAHTANTEWPVPKDTRFVDLKGAVMMPAFLDAHSHFSGYASAQLQVPLEEASDFSEIIQKIRSHISENQIPKNSWIIAKNYDHNHLAEHAHPTAAVLDIAAPDHPVVIQHQSSHMGVFNTRAMELLHITAKTPDPEGGRIFRENGRPTGYLEENAFVHFFQKIPMPSLENLLDSYVAVQDKYASYGITTIQEGMLAPQLIPLYQQLLQKQLLKLDVVAYADAKNADTVLAAFAAHRRTYQNHFKLGGLKMFLDGSPQGRTAWMRTPYLEPESRSAAKSNNFSDNAAAGNYCGYGTLTDEQALALVRKASRENLQILAHCNGDAAAAQYLRACQTVSEQQLPLKELRPVLIHGQLLGIDQMPALKKLGIIPSFFAAHVYHWGDVHLKNFGYERASHISPAAAALAQDIPFTFHQDTPVLEPDMLETIWCSVCRLTKNGVRLDAEAIPVQAALEAVTINAAYQYFEENEKGSITPGKRADFVILDQNPLTCDPMKLKNIRVLETIKDDAVLFEK